MSHSSSNTAQNLPGAHDRIGGGQDGADASKSALSKTFSAFKSIFAPDGYVYGVLFLMIVTGGFAWSWAFSFVIDLPLTILQFDKGIITEGVISTIYVLGWAAAFLFIHQKIKRRNGLISNLLLDCVLYGWGVYVFVSPVVFCFIDRKFYSLVVLFFPAPIVLFLFYRLLFCWIISIRRNVKISVSCRFYLNKIRTHDQNLDKEAHETPIYHGAAAILIPHLFFMQIIIFSSFSALMYFKGEQRWMVFADINGKVAIYKTGDYWIVKDVRRVPSHLSAYFPSEYILLPNSYIVKMEDQKYANIRMTEKKYDLTPIRWTEKTAKYKDEIKSLPEIVLE